MLCCVVLCCVVLCCVVLCCVGSGWVGLGRVGTRTLSISPWDSSESCSSICTFHEYSLLVFYLVLDNPLSAVPQFPPK